MLYFGEPFGKLLQITCKTRQRKYLFIAHIMVLVDIEVVTLHQCCSNFAFNFNVYQLHFITMENKLSVV